MKNILTFLLCISFFSCQLAVKSQISAGAGLDYNIILGTSVKTGSFTIGGLMAPDDGSRAYFANFRFYFPKSYTYETNGYALSSMTIPQNITVDVTEKLSFFTLSGGIRKYFGDGSVDDGGFFGSGGVGFIYGKQKFEVSSYDQTLYDIGSYDEQSIFDIFVILGIGYDYKVSDKLSIAAEIPLSITLKGINSREGSESPVPLILSPGFSAKYTIAE